ncbi:PREDICTED: methyltransferase-like protein 25 [Wasmannia auropunctata]|uniref:methyltransferase-like protein 25 n=1 Tax=Wasmannia auropunctata TaxID=64793 RepID=UPI0005F00FCD|nr:PREDICTED: methyltransferase-like protein 25 [Wasmannia auropunctata]
MDINAEKKYFSEALCFFYETQWLHNIPVTEILTKASLDTMPKEWMEQLQLLENEELNNFVVEKAIKSDWPDSLKTYVAKCKKLNRLPPVPALSPIELPQNFKIGLSQKKQHEIMHLAHLVDAQCKRHDIRTIIDLGAGLGYVCQMLHYLYDYRVLGLERDKKNVGRAFTRQKKLHPDSLAKVKYMHCDVTCDSADAIETILRQEFPDVTDVCLIGLHACGDLSTSASRIFREMKSAKLFILISCCYHKLSISKSVQTPLREKQYFHNFPTSNCLRETIAAYNFDVGQFLRVPFLRLACQESADKWHGMSQEKHNEHSFHVLARAVLELYSQQNNYVLNKKVRKGTRKSQCSNFQTYVKDSLLRYDLVPDTNKTDSVITRDEMEKGITRVWEEQSGRLEAVEIYTGLQMMLQLPAESLILQDRLCWLHEQGLEAVTVPVMNKCVSPRSYAIVSHKY